MLIEKLESDIPSARLAAMDVFVTEIPFFHRSSSMSTFRFIVSTNMMHEI